MAQESSRGRPISWIWVLAMIVFFTVGGVGLVAESWLVFGIGGGLFVIAGIGSLVTGILSDVH